MDKQFIDTCMSKRTKEVEPSAVEISNPVVIQNTANSHNILSNYFLKGAQSILKSNTPLLGILLGYFSMEQKTYQLLAKKGFKVTSHVCGIMGLSRVVGRKDLASALSKAYDNRLEVNYLGNIKTIEIDRFRAETFIDKTLMPFLNEMDSLIDNIIKAEEQ